MDKIKEMTNQAESDVNQCEYIQYAQDVEKTLSHLESQLHNSDDPEEIIMNTLVAAAEFYDGDWAGIMDADLTMKIWSTLFWYNRRTKSMSPNRFGDIQEGDSLWRWIDSLTHGTPMIIKDVEEIRLLSPLEYEFLKSNGVRSMVAVPFWKRPTGFLIVRNPKRYITRSSLLQMMAFVAVSSINEKRLMDSTKRQLTPEIIKTDKDIVINLFDELQIITSKGVLTGKNLKSPKISRLVVYLLLHDGRPASPYEIVRDLWNEEDIDRAGMNVKTLVYRFQQMFSQISDHRLIEATSSGYRIHPDLHVMTDLQIFEDYWNEAQVNADLVAKGHLLKKAMEIFKTGPVSEISGEQWFMPTVAYYGLRFAGVVNQLLTSLDRANDYVCILEYANIAVKALPKNAEMHFWLIYAITRLGAPEMAKSQMAAAKQMLTEDDYTDLINRLDSKLPQ